jgi:hypothetical protein
MAAPRPQSIPVFLLVKTAFHILWHQRDDALRLGFIPTLICFGGFVYGGNAVRQAGSLLEAGMAASVPPQVTLGLLATLVIVLAGTVLAVANWLRFMLLGPMGAVGLGLAIGRPHVSFLGWCVVLAFGASVAFAVLSMPMLLLLPGPLWWIGNVVAMVVIFVIGSRLSPFLVGQAIAQPISLQQAWIASRGNGVPLTSALILVQIPLWLAASVLGQLLHAVGFAAVAPLAMVFITAVFQIATAILQASVLAAAFRQIVGIRA